LRGGGNSLFAIDFVLASLPDADTSAPLNSRVDHAINKDLHFVPRKILASATWDGSAELRLYDFLTGL